MVKNYTEYINEARVARTGEIQVSALGGGLKEPLLKFETQRNPGSIGSLTIELYSNGPKNYTYTPAENIQALMNVVNSQSATTTSKLDEIASMVKQAQTDLALDLTQLFTQLESDIKTVLNKHGVTMETPSKESKK